jgi:hypothetical protein
VALLVTELHGAGEIGVAAEVGAGGNLLEPGLTVNIVAGLNRGAVLSESAGAD